jgi:hypothetical protein
MDRKIILDEISRLQETITEQTETLCQYPGKIPQIEIDIILSNTRDLYEKFRELGRINGPLQAAEKTENKIPEVVEKPVVPVFTDKPVTEKEIQNFEKTMLLDSLAQFSMLSEKIITQDKTELPAEKDLQQNKTKPQKKSSPDLFSSDNTLADKFKEEKKSLNEKLSDAAADKSIASKLQKNPIKDLKTAIGINEKFMFVNELFEGSLQKYNENINSLNSFKNKAEAMKLLEILKDEFSWKAESDACTSLYDLVSRRYM